MKQLDPKAFWLFLLSYITGWLFFAVPFGFIFGFVASSLRNLTFDELQLPIIIVLLLEFWWLILILLAVFSYVWAQLSYQNYKYELTEDGFRKELGVIWKKYVTIPYDRIQNVDIYRGLFARLLGLSDLQIQTAGMSASVGRYGVAGGGSEGRLPGLSREVAERLRDELIKRAKGSKGQGL